MMKPLTRGHQRETRPCRRWRGVIGSHAGLNLVTLRGDTPIPHQRIKEMTWLCEQDPWPAGAVDNLRRLLGQQPGDFPDGRVSILVCPIDADLGCATLSVELVMDADMVQWRDLGWQVDYQPLNPAEDLLEPSRSYQFRRD